ncbi:type II secretion system protein [Planctomycetota bacterium]|nr:type II secretion system protein [Planctomycetota bacterium]
MTDRKNAFTLIELLVVISIVALLIGILLPALAAARKSAQQMKNSANIRSVGQAFFIHSQGNNGWYAGVNTTINFDSVNDTFVDDTEIVNFSDSNRSAFAGSTVAARFMILLNGGYMSGDALYCPGEINENVTEYVHGQSYDYNGSNHPKFNSYAVPQLSTDSTILKGLLSEWRDSASSRSITVSDRLYGGVGVQRNNPITHRSVWSKGEPRWIGSIAFSDNHVELQRTSLVSAGKLSFDGHVSEYDDNIFHRGAPGNDWSIPQISQKNAAMIIAHTGGTVWEWGAD